jgi:alkyl hydroperoxide reductase subunit AhpC
MTLRINSEAPDFTAETTHGVINFHEWIGNSWAILFSHPKDFTPVCTTELGYMARLKPEFDRRNCKIIGLSVDPVGNHSRWAKDIEETQGHAVTYPMIGDPQLKVAKLYDMLPAEAGDASEGRTAADNATVRAVFVIGADKKIKAMLTYPMSSGRNFDEVLRLLDSCRSAASPANDPNLEGGVSEATPHWQEIERSRRTVGPESSPGCPLGVCCLWSRPPLVGASAGP